VYQLGPRSWRPEASLSETVSQSEAEQTCQLSHDIGLQLSEIPASTGDDDDDDDVDQLLKPTTEAVQTSSRPLSLASSRPADLPPAEPDVATDDTDTPSTRHSKLTWSASGGMKQTLADDDDDFE